MLGSLKIWLIKLLLGIGINHVLIRRSNNIGDCLWEVLLLLKRCKGSIIEFRCYSALFNLTLINLTKLRWNIILRVLMLMLNFNDWRFLMITIILIIRIWINWIITGRWRFVIFFIFVLLSWLLLFLVLSLIFSFNLV